MAMLDGKAVVITGSGRGIGAACARGAGAQGASVVVNDIDADVAGEVAEAIVAAGGRAIACPADITDWSEAGRLIDTCVARFGRIDGLVNNAALFHMAPVTAIDPVKARQLVDVNVMGPLHCTGHAVKPMVAQGSGSIVNVVSGAHMGMAGLGIYGATKGAVASMVYTWAIELAGTGVRVNGLSPFGATRMTTQVDEGVLDAETRARRVAQLQPPEANSPVVEYLLSDRAAGVNGQLVRIDKGELQLYTHPALLVPSLVDPAWTAEAIADAFDADLAHRQVACGVLGMRAGPEPLTSGYWTRTGDDGA
jgi:NAD(P)-dependent dehydrogenase (short-subunit alcohol dehydrogenase family)